MYNEKEKIVNLRSDFKNQLNYKIMRVIIQSDYQKMSQWAANHVIERINAFNPTPDHKFVLGLPTGSSPVGMYNALVEACRKGKVSFKNVITFNMDEYVGLPETHPESYHAFMAVICLTTSTALRRIFISSTATQPT